MLVISRYAAPPYPAAPDFPLCRGQNKTPRIILFISGALLSPCRRRYRHIYDGAEGAVPPQWNGTSYLPRAEPSTRPGGVSRSRTEPLAPRAKGPAAPSTLTPVRACQPSGIQLPAGGKRIAAGRQPFPNQRLRPSSHRALPRGGLLRCRRSRRWSPPEGCPGPGCRRRRLCPWVLLFRCTS